MDVHDCPRSARLAVAASTAVLAATLLSGCGGSKMAGGARDGEPAAGNSASREKSAPAESSPGGQAKLWLTDVDGAIRKATAEKKDLLLNFTGSDWCIWCQKLRREVFEDAEFLTEGAKSFVWVELDFPQNRASISPEAMKKNLEWLEKFGVEGFPTIILADAEGRPYARTGYQPGGAKKYMAHLAELRKIRERRDEELSKAAAASGVERAVHLDRALEAVGESFALTWYKAEIRQIVESDPQDASGLKSKYEEKQELAEARKVLERVNRDFDGENVSDMLKVLDEAQAKFGSRVKPRTEIASFRAELLYAANRYEEAEKVIDELLKTERLEPEKRMELALRKANILQERQRPDDAIAVFDGLIADKSLATDLRTRLRAQRADFLAELGRTDDAVQALDGLIADPESEEVRLILHSMRAGMLVEAGRRLEAIRGLEKAEAALEKPEEKAQIREMIDQLRAEESPEGSEGPSGKEE